MSFISTGLVCLFSLFAAEPRPAAAPGGIPVLIVGGANNHGWEWTTPELKKILEESGKFQVDVTADPAKTLADLATLQRYAAIVLDYNGPRWGEAAEANFEKVVKEGTGVVIHHAANNAFEGWVPYEEICALMWRKGTGHGGFHAFDVKVVDRDHPITRDLPDLVAHPDELYHGMVHMHDTDYRVLLTAWDDPEIGGTGQEEPMVLVKEYGKGRIFHNLMGHVWGNNDAHKPSHYDPQFRDLIVRGTEWAATGQVTGPVVNNTLTEAEAAMGWDNLFDGKNTEHWRGYKKDGFPAQGWVVDGDALKVIGGGGGGDLITRLPYRDFEFTFDYKVSPGANSGVMFHVTEDHDYPWETGPEFQIFDDHGRDANKTSSGSIYALVAGEPNTVKPVAEWNRGRILLVGNHLEHWLNGVMVATTELHGAAWKEMVKNSKFGAMPEFGLRKSGHLCLQDHGHDVWFRNLKVKNLDPRPEKETALFNGKDRTGWTHFLNDEGKPEDVWSVTDEGVLVCLGNPVGYLRTERDFENYTLRLQWRFSPVTKKAGNSGVLLRKIGEDKVWPRCIEAQLQSGAAGDFWNIDSFPMQASPERTKGRNTARVTTNENPIGEWNQYEITMWHGHCVLRVNGEILNQAWGCLEIPGKICLQSEGAEIHFRDIQLMPLR